MYSQATVSPWWGAGDDALSMERAVLLRDSCCTLKRRGMGAVGSRCYRELYGHAIQ